MKVHELIEELQKYDGDLEVVARVDVYEGDVKRVKVGSKAGELEKTFLFISGNEPQSGF